MKTFLLFAFLAIMAVDVWAAIAVGFRRSGGGWLCLSYFVVVPLTGVVTLLMTSLYSYYSNPNTRIFGWPIPRIVFQRQNPGEHRGFLDYFGPTICLLAYPLEHLHNIPSAKFPLKSRPRKPHAKL